MESIGLCGQEFTRVSHRIGVGSSALWLCKVKGSSGLSAGIQRGSQGVQQNDEVLDCCQPETRKLAHPHTDSLLGFCIIGTQTVMQTHKLSTDSEPALRSFLSCPRIPPQPGSTWQSSVYSGIPVPRHG